MALYRNDNGNLSLIAGSTLYADAPIGAIQAFGGSVAPSGWLLCQGQAISRTIYADLFAVIGTNFGVGDGSTTFNLPDLEGKVTAGYKSNETEFNAIGKTGGEKAHTLTYYEMPQHSHAALFIGSAGSEIGWSGINGTVNSSVQTGIAGGNQAHNNLQPYVVTNYIIKAKMLSAPADFMEAVNLKYIGTAENTVSFSGDLSKYQELILLLCPFKTASNKTFYTFNLPTLFFNIQSSIVIPQDISADGQFSTRITVSATGVTCESMGSAVTEPKVWIYGR